MDGGAFAALASGRRVCRQDGLKSLPLSLGAAAWFAGNYFKFLLFLCTSAYWWPDWPKGGEDAAV